MSGVAVCSTSCHNGRAIAPESSAALLRADLCRPARLRGRLAHVCLRPTAAATRTLSASIQLPQLPLLPSRRQAREAAPAAPEAEPELTPAPAAAEELERPVLGLAGGGIFFWWELGVLKYLQENFNLSNVDFVGVSAGALIAVLVACNVSPGRAVNTAFRLSQEAGIFERPGGLAGIWGSLVRSWLDELLPEDAAKLCRGRVKTVATRVPSLRLCYLEEFASRDAVIDACMASIHIPLFLDGNPTYNFQGVNYVDGSLWDFISGKNSAMLTCDGKACVIDYFDDDQLQYSRLDFLSLTTLEKVRELVKAGYDYGERTDLAGGYEMTLAPVRKTLIRRWVEFPARQLGRVMMAA